MFSGIVEETGRVKEIAGGSSFNRLYIKCSKVMEDIKKGDSIAVNGICLTVSDLGSDWFCADVMPETMRKTGLSQLNNASIVNLERALQINERLGGHIVTGHIDGTGGIESVVKEDNAIWLTVTAPGNILRYIVLKGSVALDGVSLTVAYVDEACFKVSLIPLTAAETVLGSRKAGDTINIECDIIGKYVERLLSSGIYGDGKKKGLTMDFLGSNGFL